MRMWNVDVKRMCDKHLLGEHVELHMFVGSIKKGISLKGYIDKGFVEVHNIRKRHREIVSEMERRGMVHKSPLPLFFLYSEGHINIEENEQILTNKPCSCSFI